ncbi:MAG: extracellular solute-binding protein [Anaerolineales bacterium]|nr:extracellular solute-binding protein [Anaerolineales bacterium]MDW8161981.1 extracellular solute-binding protein [Anaerolineales bacterium]
MLRRVFSKLLAFAVLFSLLLAACAPQTVVQTVEVPKEVVKTVEVQVTKEVQVEVPAEPGSLRMWAFFDLTDTQDRRPVQLKQIIEAFQATTGVKVEYEQVAWDQMATKVAFAHQAGGDLPDLILIGAEYLDGLINAGALRSIKKEIEGTPFYNDLNEFEKKLNEKTGDRFAVSTFINGGQWYYDTEFYPEGFPDTEEGWFSACEKLAPQGKYVATFFAGRHPAAMAQGLAPLVWSLGGTIFNEKGEPNFASEEMVKALTFWRTLLEKKCVPEIAFTGDWTATEGPFIERTAGAVRGGTWSYIYIPGLKERFEAGTVKIGNPPALSGGKQGYVFMGSDNWAVTAGAKNVENAIKFINFFFTPAVLAPWADANYGVPPTKSAMDNPIFASQFYKDSLDNLTRNAHPTEVSPYYNETMDALSAKVQELMLNPDLDILQEMSKLQEQLLNQYFK